MMTIVFWKLTVRPWASVNRPVVEQLQQDVEHLRVRLLDLVEQDHGVGPATDGLGQLAGFVVPDITGRGADQA
jgi:hypothetical protein